MHERPRERIWWLLWFLTALIVAATGRSGLVTIVSALLIVIIVRPKIVSLDKNSPILFIFACRKLTTLDMVPNGCRD